MRFPKGRATERVANDILQIADGIKKRGPIELGPPITDAVITDMLEDPMLPSERSTQQQSVSVDQQASAPSDTGMPTDEVSVGVAQGDDMVDML